MERLTRRKDQYPCRMKNCAVDEWIQDMGGDPDTCCHECPFEKYINALAEYEDKAETELDDCK